MSRAEVAVGGGVRDDGEGREVDTVREVNCKSRQ